MQSLTQIKQLLAERGLRPKRSLGQNFLVDQNLLKRLVDAAGVEPGERVLEIGPGTGTLTTTLLDRGARLVACELDDNLADLIESTLGNRLTLIRGDCLERKTALNAGVVRALGGEPFVVVANLPYGAASPFIVTVLTRARAGGDPALGPCRGLYVTIQKEVAERLRAGPGSKDYGELSVIVGAMASVERVAVLPPECFWPRPEVTSEMVAIVPRNEPLTRDPAGLSALCRRLFTQRRKQIGTVLGPNVTLPAGIERTDRAEELTIEQLVNLAAQAGASGETG